MVVPDKHLLPPRVQSQPIPTIPTAPASSSTANPSSTPFLIPAMGAVAWTLRFITFVLKLPIRHPVLVAEQVGSTAVLTDNRLLLGVGTDSVARGLRRVRRALGGSGQEDGRADRRVNGLLGGGYFEYHGEVFDVPSIKMSPTPTKPVPILIGGHHEAALRRAALVGDGWLHGGGDPEDLPACSSASPSSGASTARWIKDFEIEVISLDAYSVDGVEKLEELGVTGVIVGFRYPYDVGPGHRDAADQDRQPASLQ